MIKERLQENKAHSFPNYLIFRNGLQGLQGLQWTENLSTLMDNVKISMTSIGGLQLAGLT